MTKLSFNSMIMGALLSFSLVSCSLDPLNDDWNKELFTRAFIKEFGLIDETQDWNMAREVNVTVNLGTENVSSVKVYGKMGYKYYLVADIQDLSGIVNIPVDIPKECSDVMVKVDGLKFYGKVGETVDCRVRSRGIPGYDYSGWTEETENTNPALKTTTKGGYTVTIKHTDTGKDGGCYQYFNTQQMSPVVSRKVWDSYYSLNKLEWMDNDYGEVGMLPESGRYNRTQDSIVNWLEQKKAQGREFVIDYTIEAGANGKITLYPYYFGTNLAHVLGIYPVDDNGEPIKVNGEMVKIPVFQDPQPGDLQVKPLYNTDIKAVRVYHDDACTQLIDWEHPLELEVGETFDLYRHFRLWKGETASYQYDSEGSPYLSASVYGDSIPYATVLSGSHSRIAFHAWADNDKDYFPDAPGHFVNVTSEGLVTALLPTTEENMDNHLNGGRYYMNVSIATRLENGMVNGVHYDFPIRIRPKQAKAHYVTEKVTAWPSDLTAHAWDEYFEVEVPKSEATYLLLDIDSSNSPIDINKYMINGSLAYTDGSDYLFEEIWDYFCTGSQFATWYNNHKSNVTIRDNSYNQTDAYAIYTPSYYTAKFMCNSWNTSLRKDASQSWADFTLVDISANLGSNWFNGVSIIMERTGGNSTIPTSSELVWASDGKTRVVSDLEAYYRNHVKTDRCSDCQSGQTYTVTLDNVSLDSNADIDSGPIYYVTWKHTEDLSTQSSAPMHFGGYSRAGDSRPAQDFLEGPEWLDANCIWSKYLPGGEEVSSYIPTIPMRGRARGYDIEIKGPDGKPYTGKFGMYLEVVDSYAGLLYEFNDGNPAVHEQYKELGKASVLYSNPNLDPSIAELFEPYTEPYTVYSQRDLNQDATGAYSRQISAVTFKHPMTGRTFFAFEDMRLTHQQDTYGGYEKSSDRDINDLIFLITGYEKVSNDEDEITTQEEDEEGFSWIWALEDLGSMDDFDFNDVVIKIHSITTKISSSGATPTFVKKVVFTPLAAGGVLPIYIHLKVKGHDYVLEPNDGRVFDLTTNGSDDQKPSADGLEFHRWFKRDLHYSTMVNTQRNGYQVAANPANDCVLIVDDGFSINLLNTTKKYLDTYQKAKDDANSTFFYVTVNGSLSWDQIDKDRTTDNYILALPNKGDAAQSFIVNSNNWRWPLERAHIMLAYPKFGDWVRGSLPDTDDWTVGGNSSYTY